jgi:F-type H+-transporting ATPase subunit a
MTVPVAAEKIFDLGPLPVTNSLLMGWVAVILVGLLAWRLNRSLSNGAPRGLQNWMEWLVEQILSYMDQVTGDRVRSRRFLPIIGTLFPLILLSNWLGLVAFSFPVLVSHPTEHLPLFRAATADLNMTLGLALFSVLLSHIVGFTALGFWKYGGKFIKLGAFFRAFAAFGKKPLGEATIGVFVALVDMVVGVLEVISEVAKVISLSLRLFGNIYAGEVLLTIIASLTGKLPPFILPIPFMFLEVLVGLVQAAVFSILSLVYLSMAVDEPHGAEAGEHAH